MKETKKEQLLKIVEVEMIETTCDHDFLYLSEFHYYTDVKIPKGLYIKPESEYFYKMRKLTGQPLCQLNDYGNFGRVIPVRLYDKDREMKIIRKNLVTLSEKKIIEKEIAKRQHSEKLSRQVIEEEKMKIKIAEGLKFTGV